MTLRPLVLILLLRALSAASALSLMPMPAEVTTTPGDLEIGEGLRMTASGEGAADLRVQEAMARFRIRLSRRTGVPVRQGVSPAAKFLNLRIIVEKKDTAFVQRLGDDERYLLRISDTDVLLSADAPLGVLRGLQTLLQLIRQTPADAAPGWSIPRVSIQDGPRFGWRGLSLDVSRHFLTAADVKRTLDGMEAVKLNVFHWHLSDDEGFRIESKRFPRLQQFGSEGKFYTQAEVRDVLVYARDRGIRVVPEFDVPGHATSWMPGYPQLASRPGPFHVLQGYGETPDVMDPTRDSTYSFLDAFIGEMAKLFPDEYFHIGGDEVSPKQWEANRRIRAFMRKRHIRTAAQLHGYFNRRLLAILKRHGKRMEGWDEILQPDLPKSILIQSWRGAQSLQSGAREGFSGILSAGYYLDLMRPAAQHYAVDPLRDIAPDQQRLILGGEAAMWEETASAENIDSRLWPRLGAIAERLWSPSTFTDTGSMYQRLAVLSRYLEECGLEHRSELAHMRQRLVGAGSTEPLDVFASVLEPVKGYSRHPQTYSTTTPLNRLVDALPPESDAGRRLLDEVRGLLSNLGDRQRGERVRRQLEAWSDNARRLRPILQSNTLLNEDLPTLDDLEELCRQGLEAIGHLEAGEHASPVRVRTEPHADVVIAIGPAIQELSNLVPAP